MTCEIIEGDCSDVMRGMADGSIHTCITSPPYWGLRDYGIDGQIGLEATPEEYVGRMVEVFAEVRRMLRDDGTLWLNLGDSYNSSPSNQQGRDGTSSGLISPKYANGGMSGNGRQRRDVPGLKTKDLIGIPWRVALALQADGWTLRSDIIWAKPNPMPESVTDRPTKSHEYVFLLSKSERYYYDADAVREPHMAGPPKSGGVNKPGWEPNTQGWVSGGKGFVMRHREYNPAGRNLRTVWTVATHPFKGAHFATFPPKLVRPCVKAGCPPGGIVFDPFCGTGTAGVVALALKRSFIGIELNPRYARMARRRIERPHAPAERPAREEYHPLFDRPPLDPDRPPDDDPVTPGCDPTRAVGTAGGGG